MRMKVCALDDLDIGGAIKLDVQPPVAVIRGESGDVFAIDDTCTHADASLSEGFVEGDAVECPLHMAFFCLKSGQPSCPPATVPVKTHRVELIDGDIYVEISRG